MKHSLSNLLANRYLPSLRRLRFIARGIVFAFRLAIRHLFSRRSRQLNDTVKTSAKRGVSRSSAIHRVRNCWSAGKNIVSRAVQNDRWQQMQIERAQFRKLHQVVKKLPERKEIQSSLPCLNKLVQATKHRTAELILNRSLRPAETNKDRSIEQPIASMRTAVMAWLESASAHDGLANASSLYCNLGVLFEDARSFTREALTQQQRTQLSQWQAELDGDLRHTADQSVDQQIWQEFVLQDLILSTQSVCIDGRSNDNASRVDQADEALSATSESL